jgi:hypothetical protein
LPLVIDHAVQRPAGISFKQICDFSIETSRS